MGTESTVSRLALVACLVLSMAGCSAEVPVPVETVTVTTTPSEKSDSSPEVEQEQKQEQKSTPLVSEEQFMDALSMTNRQYDEVNEETNFYSRVRPDFEESVRVELSVYFTDDGLLEAVLAVAYLDEDWIFFDSLEARALSETFTLISEVSGDKYFDELDGGTVYEVSVSTVNSEIERALDAVLADPSANFRLIGSDGTVERGFTQIERDSISTMLTIYKGLKEGYKP